MTGARVEQTERTTRNWDPDVIGSIWQPDEPPIYGRKEISGLHADAKGGKTGLVYKAYTDEERKRWITNEDLTVLRDSGVHEVYDYFAGIERSHGLKINCA